MHSQTHFADQFNENAMSREAYERTKERNLKNASRPPLRHTFDPIYFPLEQYKDFYDHRRPDIEQLADEKATVDGASDANRRKNHGGTLRSWLSSVYHTNPGNIPKRKEFEDAIDTFIDENYLISSKMKRQMQEIEELCEQIEMGVEMTEDLNLDASEEPSLADGEIEVEAGVDTSGDTVSPSVECQADDSKNEPQTSDGQSSDSKTAGQVLDVSTNRSPDEPEEVENKTLAPFVHRKYMKEDQLLPLPWMTKKIQAYPFLPPSHRYIVRHVFGLSLEDTICRCVWFEDDDDLSFKLRHEYSYLSKIEEWRQQYGSEQLDWLLNYNRRLDDDQQVPVIDLFYPKLDLNTFDLVEFERQLAVKRVLVQEQIRSQPKLVKDCTRKVPELGERRQSKSFIKDFLRGHSISKNHFR